MINHLPKSIVSCLNQARLALIENDIVNSAKSIR